VRQQIIDAVRDLATHLVQMKAVVKGREVDLKAEIDGVEMTGRADLLLARPPAVIDVKWGSERRHRDYLAHGTAHQLAVYARLAGGDDGVLPSAYYIVDRQALLTTTDRTFRGALRIDGPPGAETFDAFRRALDERLDELAAGEVTSCARDADEELPESALEEGVLRLEPSCRFCEFLHLCGGRRD
jgi:hypothetical protein